MIVDCHVHVYPPEVVADAEKIGRTEEHFALLASGKVHKWASIEDVIEGMDRDGVDQSWIFGFAFKDQGLCSLCNDYVLEGIRRYPERLKGLAVVSPSVRGAEEEVIRRREEGFIGVGEIFPQGQNLDLTDIRQTWRLAGAADEAGMLLLIHTAEPVGHDYAGKGNVGPREAAEFCINHPEARVIFAHFGGGLWLYELMPEMRLYLSNARYDCAAWPWLYDPAVLAAMETAGVGDKIMYGSDFPILALPRYEKLLDASGVSDGVREKFLSGNALSFLAGEESPVNPS
ncbi:MAG: amidohydrolase family protein [Synergistaceae bacterium]|nr:amidohydrolase family protein [Synergistaceae bacterium]